MFRFSASSPAYLMLPQQRQLKLPAAPGSNQALAGTLAGVNHLPASSPAYIALPQQKQPVAAPVSAQTVAGTLAGVNLASGSGHTQFTSAVGISLNISGSPEVNSCDSQDVASILGYDM